MNSEVNIEKNNAKNNAKNNSDKYILAVDHGTSGVKTAIVSVFGDVLGFESEKTPIYLHPVGGAEQNPDEWWSAFLISAKKLVEKNLVPREKIIAICVSGQWGCTVAVDDNGNHLMNAISWMDSRGAPFVKKEMSGIINISGYGISNVIRWVPKTGGAPALAGKDPIAHILWIKNEHPEIYEKTYKFLESKDFMNLKLTGKFAASFDSIHLHWITDIRDIHNIHYDNSLIRKLKLDPEKFPDLIKSTDILGKILPNVADRIGLNHDADVICGSGDLQSSAIGSGAVNDFEGHIYIGTSSFVICHCPYKKTDIFHNIASLPSSNPDKYFVASEQDSAGACLTFLKDNIAFYSDQMQKIPHSYSELDEIAEKTPPGSNNLIFTPWLYGERTPIEDSTIRGGIHNLTLSTNMNDIIRSVFEGVAFNSRWVLEYVEKFIKQKLDPINIIGGGAISDIWCQIYADVLNRTIRRVKNPIQANARGAAFIASVALGNIKFEDIKEYTEFDKIFQPNPENREIYDKLSTEFTQIYKKTAGIYRKLNG